MGRGKRYRESAKLLEEGKQYSLNEGVDLLKQMAVGKFDETVDIAVRLGVDPKHADQMVRGAI
ncbi:MAG: 50S ribosomal protein L1, partial [Myxococcota bacterium]